MVLIVALIWSRDRPWASWASWRRAGRAATCRRPALSEQTQGKKPSAARGLRVLEALHEQGDGVGGHRVDLLQRVARAGGIRGAVEQLKQTRDRRRGIGTQLAQLLGGNGPHRRLVVVQCLDQQGSELCAVTQDTGQRLDGGSANRRVGIAGLLVDCRDGCGGIEAELSQALYGRALDRLIGIAHQSQQIGRGGVGTRTKTAQGRGGMPPHVRIAVRQGCSQGFDRRRRPPRQRPTRVLGRRWPAAGRENPAGR